MIAFDENSSAGAYQRCYVYDCFGIIRPPVCHIAYKYNGSFRFLFCKFFSGNVFFPYSFGKFPHCLVTPLHVSYDEKRNIIWLVPKSFNPIPSDILFVDMEQVWRGFWLFFVRQKIVIGYLGFNIGGYPYKRRWN